MGVGMEKVVLARLYIWVVKIKMSRLRKENCRTGKQ